MAGLTEFTRVGIGGREGPTNLNFRVGVLSRDPHFGGGFGDAGLTAASRMVVVIRSDTSSSIWAQDMG